MPISRLYAATGSDLISLSLADDHRWTAETLMADAGIQCVAANPDNRDRLFFGTFDNGLFRSNDGGATTKPIRDNIEHDRVMSLAFGPIHESDTQPSIYVGTEPSAVYRSTDDGTSWQSLDALQNLPSQPEWSFPPRPWTSHVRWIATHPADSSTVYVGIELGGVMVTRDDGQTWEDRKDESYFDCHCLATHPSKPERVYEAAGGGVALSEDAGRSWRKLDEGLEHRYVWGLAVDPADPDIWYVSAASSASTAHRNDGNAAARIYRKQGSKEWEAITPPLSHMPYVLLADLTTPGFLLAGFQHGEIWSTADHGDTWQQNQIEPAIDHLQSLAIG